MYLSQLELFGFKSFANKTQLKFDDGIACVIGPNGSGKSNIVDAIRWVLGEQKVSTLRSDKMESVIFNGSKKRKPLGLAEVSLTIQNNKKILESPFSEVVISRRLYRNGESQYLLNKAPCRLKDITNMFMDTGMNANSYSVIELKMVESIISENPEERRILFEEAAGVTKYKIRRRSAIRKLSVTTNDMSRISDMISEISRTVNSLSRQVGKARRFLKFQDELKTKETDLARYKFNIYQDEIHPLEKQLKEISIIKEDTTHQITLEETLLEDYKQEIIQFEQKLSDINKQIYNFDKEIQTLQEEDAVSRTRIDALKETKMRNLRDIEEYEIKLKSLQENLIITENESRQLITESEKIEAIYNNKLQEYEKLLNANNVKKENLNSQQSKFNNITEQLSDLKEKKQNLNYRLQWNEKQLENENQLLKDIDKNNNQTIQEIDHYNSQKVKIIEEQKNNTKQLDSLQAKSKDIDQTIEELNSRLNTLESKKTILNSKIDFFRNIIESYEGYSESTKYFMQNISSYPGLHGPLSSFVSTASQYSNAVEVALGASINYLIVDKTSTALSLLEECKRMNLGRISILPLDRISNTEIEPENNNLNFFPDLITVPAKYKNIFGILFGDIAIVNDLDEAISLLNKYPAIRFVTKDGETINFDFGISGGNKTNNEDSLIGREEHLKNFEQELKITLKDIDKLILELNKQAEKKKQFIEKTQLLNIEKDEINKRIQSIENNIAHSNFVRKNNIDTKEIKQAEIVDLNKTIKNLKNEIQTESIKHEELQKQYLKIEAALKTKTFEMDKELAELNDVDKIVQDLKLKSLNKKNTIQIKENDLNRLKETILELNELEEKRKTQNNEINIEIEEMNQKSIERKQNKEKVFEDRDKKDSEKENYEVSYHEIRDKILNLENQIKKYRKQHDSSLERTRQLELNIQENRMKADVIKERIKEEYNLDISIGIPFEGINVEEYDQEIETLKYKIKQLGQVNPLAVNEYDTEKKRLEFYQKQYGDLELAINSLNKTIDKINLTARKQFKETFDLIKNNFEKVFSSFFVNGEGSLELEDGVDPLEADINIFVRPKGKRVQTLNLLSGGEKTLTAISLLFAIYLVKPSPFCILDEIDAPLDDVNIKRFTDALQNFSHDTQFIVITHNKRTMESADTLYGVTMEEEGLSKLVSVKFN